MEKIRSYGVPNQEGATSNRLRAGRLLATEIYGIQQELLTLIWERVKKLQKHENWNLSPNKQQQIAFFFL